jgi:cytoskeletal protein CcmA (bactofilin family)
MMIDGEVTSVADLVVDCRVHGGPVWSDGHSVTVTSEASVTGDIIARDITVWGTVSGTLLATEIVHIGPSATVTGRVVAPRLILGEGAQFNGSVEPQHLESALRVARHRRGAK